MIKYFLISWLLFIFFSGCRTDVSELPGNDIKKETEISVTDIYCVGMSNNLPSIYKYDFHTKTSEVFWERRNHHVIDLSFVPSEAGIFFLTAQSYGKRGVFPFVNNVKVFQLVDADSDAVNLSNLGSGLQVYSTREDNSNFKVVLNDIDKTVSSYIEQTINVFNRYGKLIFDEHKRYDLSKEGYPIPQNEIKNLSSPDKKYSIRLTGDNYFILSDNKSSEEKEIGIKHNLNQVEWFDGRYLIFTTLDVTAGNETLYDSIPETSTISVYSIKENKIIYEVSGGGYKNFILNGSLLIYDDGFRKNSSIIIFDLNGRETFDEINIEGGCGLKNIPEPPDYSA
jgi:hypothetical protein